MREKIDISSFSSHCFLVTQSRFLCHFISCCNSLSSLPSLGIRVPYDIFGNQICIPTTLSTISCSHSCFPVGLPFIICIIENKACVTYWKSQLVAQKVGINVICLQVDPTRDLAPSFRVKRCTPSLPPHPDLPWLFYGHRDVNVGNAHCIVSALLLMFRYRKK